MPRKPAGVREEIKMNMEKMNPEKIIQVLAKIGKILSKIIYICCIVGFWGCIVGILALAFGAEAVKLEGLTLHTLLEDKAGISLGTLYVTIAGSLVLCIGEAFLARKAERYFTHELAAGTPFTVDGAQELWRLGILTVAVSLGSQVLSAIVQATLMGFWADARRLSLNPIDSVALGLGILLAALLCRNAAAREQQRDSLQK